MCDIVVVLVGVVYDCLQLRVTAHYTPVNILCQIHVQLYIITPSGSNSINDIITIIYRGCNNKSLRHSGLDKIISGIFVW